MPAATRLTTVLKRVRGDRVAERLASAQRKAATQSEKRLRDDVAALSTQVGELRELVRALAAGPTAPPPEPGTSDPTSWQGTAQTGELKFHTRNADFRGDDAVWEKALDEDWHQLGLARDSWSGRTIVDLGAGSRLRTLWFDPAELIVIEPLADQFRAEVPWCDLDRADEVYSVAGEEFVPEVEGRADVVVSINAVDHGYDLRESMRNVRRYLKADGEALISLDMHDQVSDHMHPMIVTHPMMLEIFADVGLQVTRTEERRRYHGGVGPGARHYWLRTATHA